MTEVDTDKRPLKIQHLELEYLVPSPDNHRARGAGAAAGLRSLAQSLKAEGMLQPIVVRPHPTLEGKYEIRAGERRWRAAKLAGMETVPVVIKTLDDQSALAVTITENLQRENPHPLDEAATIQQAFERGYDIKGVAARLGKSVPFVARRAALTRLARVWVEAVHDAGQEVSRFTAGHLELIARLPKETQEALAEEQFQAVFRFGFPSVVELARIIDGQLATLRAMPWSLKDERLVPDAGSCLACPKRSGQQPMLFAPEDAPGRDGKVSRSDRCLDPECYSAKMVAFLGAREEELREKHPHLQLVQLTHHGVTPGVREALGARCTWVHEPEIVGPRADRAIPVMQVDAPAAGKMLFLRCPPGMENEAMKAQARRNATVASLERRGGTGAVEGATLAQQREEKLTRRRDTWFVKSVREKVAKWPPSELLAALCRRTEAGGAEEAGSAGKTVVIASLQEVLRLWHRRLRIGHPGLARAAAQDAAAMCEVLGLDIEALELATVTQVRAPRAWGYGFGINYLAGGRERLEASHTSASRVSAQEVLEQRVEECPFDCDDEVDEDEGDEPGLDGRGPLDDEEVGEDEESEATFPTVEHGTEVDGEQQRTQKAASKRSRKNAEPPKAKHGKQRKVNKSA